MPDTLKPSDAKPAPKPPEKVNRIGLPLEAYKGAESTLCSGCGHDSITGQIIKAYFEAGVRPHTVAKLSGIGCSSKTPAYFMQHAYGLNAVHGRMAAIASGVKAANRTLNLIGISGDGDTASIGIGHFMHLIRRNTACVYIIENNGVYGLTKGQFSATADVGSALKKGEVNQALPIDCCSLALELGGTFVARSFSADMKQLCALIKAAIHHSGTALIDVLSPCVTFNNHEGSTRSYKYAKEHEIPLHEIDFIDQFEAQAPVEIAPGETRDVALYDGSRVRLKKLSDNYDPTDRDHAVRTLARARRENLFLTGLLYLDNSRQPLVDQLNLVDEPLAGLPAERTRPPQSALDDFNASLA